MEFTDIHAQGGFVISAEQIRTQYEYARDQNHANCYLQLVRNQYHESQEDFIVCLVYDLFNPYYPTKSVTNDAEFVTQCAWKYVNSMFDAPDVPIIYKDTDGNWDELRHNEGNFACFRALEAADENEAMLKAYGFYQQDHRVGQDN